MSTGQFDLVIAYRIYPGLGKNAFMRDEWSDKYHFSEVCLKSMLRSLDGIKFKVYAILDGCDDRYEGLFRGLCKNLEIVRFNTPVGNKATFAAQIEVLLRQDESATVYFAEDDYFYLEGAFPAMLDLVARDDVDFVTPYDHPDYYRRPELNNHKSEIIFQAGRHWRTAASTCLTFMTTKRVLEEAERPLRSYSRISDFALWLAITKLKKFDAPWKTLRRMYKHNILQMLAGRAFKLWAPMPGIANHMAANHAVPGIDWDNLIRKYR